MDSPPRVEEPPTPFQDDLPTIPSEQHFEKQQLERLQKELKEEMSALKQENGLLKKQNELLQQENILLQAQLKEVCWVLIFLQ